MAADAVIPDRRGNFPILGQISVSDGEVIYKDAPRELDMDLKLSTLSGDAVEEKESFTVTGKGTLSGKAFSVDATGGSLKELRDSARDYPLRADIVMGDTRVQANGTFGDPLKMSGVNTALSIQGPNLADLFYLTAIPFPPTPAYNLNGRISEDGDIWRFQIDKGTVGNSDLHGTGSYDVGRERGLFKADLKSGKMYLDDLGGFIGLKPHGKETVAPRERLFPDVPIDLSRLRKTDMDVRLQAASLVAPGWPFESLDVRFLLDKGLLRVDPANAGIASGQMSGSIVVDGRKEVPSLETDIMLRHLSMKNFFDGTRFESLSSGRFGGRIRLSGSGKSLADALGSSNGRLSLLMAGGEMSLLIIEASGIDIAEFAERLLGQDKTTRVRCGIADFSVANGQLASDIFVFDTTDTRLEGQAAINLKNETINAQIEAHPKDVSPLAARTPLRITGPLKHPKIGLNPEGLAARGAGAAVLALLNPLAAIIPFLEPGGGENADCRGLIRDVRARYGGAIDGPTPDQAPAKGQ
jgi:uncharacterized protein involved in outer membrane biogenesis